MDSTCEDSSFSSSLFEQHKSANKVQSLFFPLPLWHKVVQGIPATLQEHLEAIEQSVTQLHAVTLLNSWHGRIHFYDVFIIISPVGNS